jgi:hypothetical protein
MNQTTRLQAYGLDVLLTGQDDPLLWEAALCRHWPSPNSSDCLVDALRFDIGRRLAEGEQPQGETNDQHAKMRGLVDIEEWCFERVDSAQLRIKRCPDTAGAGFTSFPGIGLAVLMSGQAPYSYSQPIQVVFIYLGISRPSQEAGQAVVYAGSSAPGMGEGNAYLWQRQADGTWEQSDQRVARWIA